ncbi:MAG TPA: L-glutamate gamma-semialdehyde dehydrogenase [Myxococcaceae bacterium]
MFNASTRVPTPRNEPIFSYAPNDPAKADLKAQLKKTAGERPDIPLVIGGKQVRSGKTQDVRMPHKHQHVLATYHEADADHVQQAISAAMAARYDWSMMPFQERAAIFLRAAEILAGRGRAVMNAATMLGQSKTAFQSEIDSICESVDFIRFNVHFAQQIMENQPVSDAGMWNLMDYRPLDGFVLAVAPFNFTAITVNLVTAPAIMGNTIVLKPASTAMLSAWNAMEVFREAGVPDGVINFVPGRGSVVGTAALTHPDLGGVHFTGSTPVFQGMWKTVGDHIEKYRQYPRLVGETGGKDFIFAHASAADDLDALATAIVRGGFEYQGQKCSACSRVYVPESIWGKLKGRLQEWIAEIKVGDVSDFRNFMGAVIDEASFKNVASYIELAKKSSDAAVIAGGETDRREGWLVRPTLVQVQNPRHRVMCEEIFAPLVSLYVYPDAKFEETLKICDETAPYALTGAIFARDRKAITTAANALRHAAGNFYINDKPTGAVVGQQPFGGSRASGTNDKAGSLLNLVRWTSPRTVKENLAPPSRVGYPFMGAE